MRNLANKGPSVLFIEITFVQKYIFKNIVKMKSVIKIADVYRLKVRKTYLICLRTGDVVASMA
jgi:hypothetical protein